MSAASCASHAPEVLIVGGGVAAIGAALSLQGRGWRITILEADPRNQQRGHGLLLPPSAADGLEQLGVPIGSWGLPIQGFDLRHREGSRHRRFDLDGWRGVLRRQLMACLLGGLADGVELRQGRGLGLVPQADGTYQVRIDNGQCLRADLIVAADGVASPCRRSLFPAAGLTPERVTELVLDLPEPKAGLLLQGQCRKYEDPEAGLALGLLPCGADRLVLYAQLATARYPLVSPLDGLAVLRRLFSGWNPSLDHWLARLGGRVVHRWRTTDLDPLPRLHRGNVVLVGDAAHPLLPFTSQGVPAALANAQTLGQGLVGVDLRRPAELSTALACYSDRRLPVLAQLIEQGRQLQHRFLSPPPAGTAPLLPLAGCGSLRPAVSV
ncbi:MAG: FAD-dependent oxidoreductase [Cyanobacteriota bacterium]